MGKKKDKKKKHIACSNCNNPIETDKSDNIVKCSACGAETPKR